MGETLVYVMADQLLKSPVSHSTKLKSIAFCWVVFEFISHRGTEAPRHREVNYKTVVTPVPPLESVPSLETALCG